MTPWVRRIIVANIVLYFVALGYPQIYAYFGFVPAAILVRPWTAVTYMFLHATPGIGHVLFNMIGLFFFGPRLETRLGSPNFLRLYLVAGVVGALLSFTAPHAMVIGASGAVYGVLLGFAYYWPRERIYIWALLPIEARWLVIGFTVMSIYFGLGGARTGIAYFAHLGGFLGAFLYLKWLERTSPAKKFQKKVAGPGAKLGDRQAMEQWEKIRPESLHEVNRDEFERIGEKIQAQGVSSLTPRERTFIERFSRG